MKTIGIDSGITGAVAVVDSYGAASVFDVPTIAVSKAGKKKQGYCPELMIQLLKDLGQIDLAILEHQQPMGIEGVNSAFNLGYGYALWVMALAVLQIPREIVRPADWKRYMLLGRDKDNSIARAIELFPTLASSLSRKKDHNRAEALLLAEYGRRIKASNYVSTN